MGRGCHLSVGNLACHPKSGGARPRNRVAAACAPAHRPHCIRPECSARIVGNRASRHGNDRECAVNRRRRLAEQGGRPAAARRRRSDRTNRSIAENRRTRNSSHSGCRRLPHRRWRRPRTIAGSPRGVDHGYIRRGRRLQRRLFGNPVAGRFCGGCGAIRAGRGIARRRGSARRAAMARHHRCRAERLRIREPKPARSAGPLESRARQPRAQRPRDFRDLQAPAARASHLRNPHDVPQAGRAHAHHGRRELLGAAQRRLPGSGSQASRPGGVGQRHPARHRVRHARPRRYPFRHRCGLRRCDARAAGACRSRKSRGRCARGCRARDSSGPADRAGFGSRIRRHRCPPC